MYSAKLFSVWSR